jgi:hypothetical protein
LLLFWASFGDVADTMPPLPLSIASENFTLKSSKFVREYFTPLMRPLNPVLFRPRNSISGEATLLRPANA